MKNKINERVDLGFSISIESFNELLMDIKNQYINCYNLTICVPYSEGGAQLIFERDETDLEYQERLEKEKTDQKKKELQHTKREQRRFKTYLKLKEKYEKNN